MKNVLFIYGFGSSKNGTTATNLRKYLHGGYKVHCFDYTQENASIALEEINNYIKANNIEMVVGSSLGGFLTMNVSCDVDKIVINPCVFPSRILPSIGASPEMVETYKKFEGKSTNIDNIVGFFGTHDELLGETFVEYFKENVSENVMRFNSGHRVSEEGLSKLIVPYIKSL